MRYLPLALTILCCLALLNLGRAAPAAEVVWPENIQRGANLGIFPRNPDHYSEEDIAHLALDWRANSVRVLINDIVPDTPPYLVDDATRDDLFKLIDYCLKYKLYTVISISSSFDSHDAFFANEDLMDAFRDFWVEIATRFADSTGVAYDLMNEPHDRSSEIQWSGYAKELTAAVRAVDSVHTIVIEPPGWGWPEGFEHLEPTGDDNTVYSFHFYGPMDYTAQRYGGKHMATPESAWRQRVYPGVIVSEWGQETWNKDTMRSYVRQATAFRNKYDVKLYCGEFGCARWALGADKWFDDWVSLLEEENIGWAYYAYREWHHMDLEMDPAERVNATERSETALTAQFRNYYARNAVPLDFNRDGIEGLSDVMSLIAFQLDHPGSLAGDFNGDGKAGIGDALAMLLHLGRGH